MNMKATLGYSLSYVSLAIMGLAWAGLLEFDTGGLLYTSLALLAGGIVVFSWGQYEGKPGGIKNNGVFHSGISNRGLMAILLTLLLTVFYCYLYWWPEYLGNGTGANGSNERLIGFFDPLAQLLKGKNASQWFVYGVLYTLLILSLGVKFLMKYKHSRYHTVRTLVMMASQLFLAFLIPEILEGMNVGGDRYFSKDIKNFWPLNYYFYQDWHLNNMLSPEEGNWGMFFLAFGIIGTFVLTPFITYFFGKRWYCSWFCGCGGLAESAGDPFRHLSSKTLASWKLERWMIHGIMVLVFIMTAATLYGYFFNQGDIFGLSIYEYFQKPYGMFIGAAFSGVIGVGFYPALGNRVWCRFGCPMAGYMGLIQRFKSRYRITTNGGQCISCGNCSTYCEQGIDVRSYAQRGEDIVRASCVGCGVCSAVCPRGVLNLENGPEDTKKFDYPIAIGKDGFNVSGLPQVNKPSK